jgi:drug/metabolite transporter (DMT)-like permease
MCQALNTPSYFIFMVALQYIPIGTAMIVENMAPFIVAALSYCTIREKTSISELLNMLVCFGVLCATIL